MARTNRNKAAEDRATRPKRIPVSAPRAITDVYDKDDDYVYRWVIPTTKEPHRVERFKQGGYEVVDQDVQVGEASVDSSTGPGSVVTMNHGQGSEAVLMRVKRDFYEEDQRTKQNKINASENAIKNRSKEDGHYGKIEVT
jgi:hypothetical protein